MRTIGLQAKDLQILTVQFPDGSPFAEYRAPPLDNDKAQAFVTAGRRRSKPTWPTGSYKATYTVMRDGAEVLRKAFTLEIGE